MKLIRTILLFALAVLVTQLCARQQFIVALTFAFIGLASLTSWHYYNPLRFGENDFGALANSTLIHDVMDDFAVEMSPVLRLALNLGELQSDGGLVRTLRPGQVVTVTNYFTPQTPYDVNAAGGYTAKDYNVGPPVTITMPNNPWANSIKITPAEFRVLTGGPRTGAAYDELRKKINKSLFYGIKLKMCNDLMAIITAGNFTNNTVSAGGTFARSTEIDIDTAIFGRNVEDRANATIILSPTAFGEWAKDHIIVNTHTNADQVAMLMSGGVQSQISPFKFWRTNIAMPTDAARGFAFTRTAAMFVNRIPDEPGLGAGAQPATGSDAFNSLATVIDADSGFAFLVRTWKNWQTGHLQMDVASIWLFAPLQGPALQRITAA